MRDNNLQALRYLSGPLREITQHHLHSTENVLTAIYLKNITTYIRDRWLWLPQIKQIQLPVRAFVLTEERSLVLEDPTDPAASTVDREYLVASCPLNSIMFFELRSHLLDCALTLVRATSNRPEHIIIEYNGVSENAFLAAIMSMRALIDGQPLPSSTRPDETYARERMAAWKGWHSVLSGLELRQENAIARYLVTGERVHGLLSVPAIDESMWWQRLGIGVHEQPPALLVRTNRQILLVKETKRIIHGQSTYGSDASVIPLERLHTARIIAEQEKLYLQIVVEHLQTTESVRLPILPELAERTQALFESHATTSKW